LPELTDQSLVTELYYYYTWFLDPSGLPGNQDRIEGKKSLPAQARRGITGRNFRTREQLMRVVDRTLATRAGQHVRGSGLRARASRRMADRGVISYNVKVIDEA
jgi:hypothetical protein